MGLIYLDACLVIDAIENHPTLAAAVTTAMAAVSAGSFAVSPLVALKCLVKPMRHDDLALQRRYEDGLARFTQLTLTPSIYSDASRLRARFGIKTPDALHLACALHHGCKALWTNDDRLTLASHGHAVNVLRTSVA